MKMLNTSAEGNESRAQPVEEVNVCLEPQSCNADKQTDAFQRFLLECDMHESDMMLETSMSDTSTWLRNINGSKRNFEHEMIIECDAKEDTTNPLPPPSIRHPCRVLRVGPLWIFYYE